MRLEDMSKHELIDLIKSSQSRRNYGLIWEHEKASENLINNAINVLPILEKQKSQTVASKHVSKYSNYLIEGDNYFVLKILRYTHFESVDVIYIDPPYNTGKKDFKYNDRFIEKDDPYRHSSWLNFMSKRLRLAKDLLKEDGIIFISIDDNEMPQLKLLCDSIFGEKNFIANLIWEKKRKASNLDSNVRGITEYVLAYGSRSARPLIHPIDKVEENKPYPFYNSGNKRDTLRFPSGISFTGLEDGFYKRQSFKAKKTLVTLKNDVTIKNGKATNAFELEGEWRYSQKWLDNSLREGEEIVFKGKEFKPYWINKSEDRNKNMKTLLNYDNYLIGTNEDGNEELFQVIGDNDFDFPKPVSLIKALINATTKPQDEALVLDFFAGTGTTGVAVLELNVEDNGNRRFILVTNNENEICTEITYPRIKKTITGYTNQKKEKVQGLGGNLDYFRTKFLKKSQNSDDMKIRIMDNCVDLLCFREGVFDEVETSDENFKIFRRDSQILGIYNGIDQSHLKYFKKVLDKLDGNKKVYIFTFDNEGLNPNDFIGWKDIEIEPIPKKILEVIGELNAI